MAKSKKWKNRKLEDKKNCLNNWTWGAEPVAAVPGEPIEFYKADENLENAEAALLDTRDGEYYIVVRGGRYIRNPKNSTALFKTPSDAKNEFCKQLKTKSKKTRRVL